MFFKHNLIHLSKKNTLIKKLAAQSTINIFISPQKYIFAK